MARLVLTLLGLVALAAPGLAAAHDGGPGDNETRVRVACLGGTAELRLRARGRDDGGGTIEVELRVDGLGRVRSLRVVLLHERMLVHQEVRSTRTYRLRLTVPDWPGRETFTARITSTSERTCLLEAAV